MPTDPAFPRRDAIRIADAKGFGLVELASRSGVTAQFLPTGALFALRHRQTLINQVLPGPAEDGLFRLLMSDLHQPVNLGNPEEWTVRRMAEAIRKLAGSSAAIVHEKLPVDDPKVRQPDASLAERALGWKPVTSIEAGLRETLDYFRRKILDGDSVETS